MKSHTPSWYHLVMLRTNLGPQFVLLASLLVVGCADDPVKPSSADSFIPPLTVSQLLSSPTSLSVNGTPVSAGVWLGRSPGTSSVPEGWPLGAAAYLDAASDAPLRSISDVYLWLIRDQSEVWATTMSYFDRTPNGGYAYESKDGPRWDIGATVDVVVGIRTAGGPVHYVLIRGVRIIAIG
jgi:hypothetical protein